MKGNQRLGGFSEKDLSGAAMDVCGKLSEEPKESFTITAWL